MYKPYIKRLLFACLVFIIGAIVCASSSSSALFGICTVGAFVTWYAAMMAPDHEKYKDNNRR